MKKRKKMVITVNNKKLDEHMRHIDDELSVVNTILDVIDRTIRNPMGIDEMSVVTVMSQKEFFELERGSIKERKQLLEDIKESFFHISNSVDEELEGIINLTKRI